MRIHCKVKVALFLSCVIIFGCSAAAERNIRFLHGLHNSSSADWNLIHHNGGSVMFANKSRLSIPSSLPTDSSNTVLTHKPVHDTEKNETLSTNKTQDTTLSSKTQNAFSSMIKRVALEAATLRTKAPVSQRPTLAPVTRRPTLAPVTRRPTILAPAKRRPTLAPVTRRPTTFAPVTQKPVTQRPTLAPMTPAPVKPPEPPAPIDPYDLGLRYNKIKFKNDIVPEGAMLPMMPEDYPIDLATAQWFRKSLCPSIIVEADCKECDISFKNLIDLVGGLPSNPSSNITSPFWENFREVVDMQKKRLNNASVSEFIPLPVVWQGFNISNVADAVHNEILGIYHLDLIKLFFASGSKVDTTIIPSDSMIEFLRGIVLVCYLNFWAVSAVGPLNFGVKYYVGRMRPEEVVWKIHKGEIEAPDDLVQTIANFQLTSMTSFTAYPEGCPQHPSWPAMHSAASSASLWLPVVMNLTEAQVCEVKRLDYAISYARTVAGVHYPDDNIAGLNIGQEIIALKLADELHTKYGSDIDVVNEKINLFRFDWNDFKMSDCYLDGITA